MTQNSTSWTASRPYDIRRLKNLAPNKPPVARAANRSTMPVTLPPEKGDAVTGLAGVAVGDGNCTSTFSTAGDGARVAVEVCVGVAGGGICVAVAGGVT